MASLSFASRSRLILAGLGLFVLWFVVAATWFLRTYLGPVTPDQVLYHLQHGGLDYADPRMIGRAARDLLATLLVTLACLWLLTRLPRWAKALSWLLLCLGAAVSVNATVSDPCLAGAGDYLAQHYVDPGEVSYTVPAPSQRPDVLLIFIESFDEDYTRPREPSHPLAPQLSVLHEDYQTFGQLRNLSDASWTVGGMFTALCGVPLHPVGLMSRSAFEYSKEFFDGGNCLTDVLAQQGWDISFYGGAELKFAGKGRFFKVHHVLRRFGLKQWLAQGVPTPPEGWGVLDAELAQRAWKDMNRPRETHADAGGDPRMSILLTVDTHGPAGAEDAGCAPARAAQSASDDEIAPETMMRDALRCTDGVVTRLAKAFASQADGRPKVVWIMGDHLAPTKILAGDIAPSQQPRTLFHALARFDGQGHALPGPDSQRLFSHVDVLPTLAEAIGLTWAPDAHHLGLGVSLLAGPQTKTLVEQDGFERVNGRLSCHSPLFDRLWTKRSGGGQLVGKL